MLKSTFSKCGAKNQVSAWKETAANSQGTASSILGLAAIQYLHSIAASLFLQWGRMSCKECCSLEMEAIFHHHSATSLYSKSICSNCIMYLFTECCSLGMEGSTVGASQFSIATVLALCTPGLQCALSAEQQKKYI